MRLIVAAITLALCVTTASADSTWMGSLRFTNDFLNRGEQDWKAKFHNGKGTFKSGPFIRYDAEKGGGLMFLKQSGHTYGVGSYKKGRVEGAITFGHGMMGYWQGERTAKGKTKAQGYPTKSSKGGKKGK